MPQIPASAQPSPMPPPPPPPPATPSRSMVWSPAMKTALLQRLYNTSVTGGLRHELSFKPVVWISACEDVNAVSTGHIATPAKCKSKSDACKRDWRHFAMFQGKSGWTYNDEGVPLEPRDIINEWFAGHKECRKYRHDTISHRAWHEEIYQDVIATGEDAVPPPGYGTRQVDDDSDITDITDSAAGDTRSQSSASATNWIRQREKEVELSNRRLRKKPIKVGTILGTELSTLNANISALVRSTSDPQTNALEVFGKEFGGLSFQHKEKLMDLFESVFECKRFLAVSGRWERIKWVHRRVPNALAEEDDRDGLWEDLDELAAPFEAADIAEKAQDARVLAESRLLGRDSPPWDDIDAEAELEGLDEEELLQLDRDIQMSHI